MTQLKFRYVTLATTEVMGSNSRTSPKHSKPVFTCSKLTIETLEQGVKYVQS